MRVRWDRLVVLGVGLVVLTVVGVNILTGGRHVTPAQAAPHRSRPAPAATQDPPCPAPAHATVIRAAAGEGPRTVALTFDDGPGRWTPQVLQVLRRNHVPATFFMIGDSARTHEAEVAAVAAQGHLIGNHTWSHTPPPAGGRWPAARLGEELDRTSALLRQLTGHRLCYFRPPAGVLAGTSGPASERGLSVVLWSVDSVDWRVQEGFSADPGGVLARRIVAQATAAGNQAHPVVLLHDGGGYRGATVEALQSVIDYYRSHGYRFVRLDGR